jgi:uncharacterized C2H2 Zn-finger protein
MSKCGYCDERFHTINERKTHVRNVHQAFTNITITHDGKKGVIFVSGGQERMFKCPFGCGMSTRNIQGLQKHVARTKLHEKDRIDWLINNASSVSAARPTTRGENVSEGIRK